MMVESSMLMEVTSSLSRKVLFYIFDAPSESCAQFIPRPGPSHCSSLQSKATNLQVIKVGFVGP